MEPLYKCVWMTAGVLSFRLCDRDYDCDRCLVDMALREGSTPPGREVDRQATSAGIPVSPAVSGLRFSRAGFYHPAHLWARVEGGGIVRVGIDDLARRLLGRVRAIRMPHPGATLRPEQHAWTFDGEAGTVVLPSPIGGTVLSRNEDLLVHPEKLLRTPHREVWLARIRPSRLPEDLGGLLYGGRVTAWLRGEVESVRAHLLAARASEVGALPDGGALDPGVLSGIEVGLRRSLVEELLLRSTRDQKGR